MRDPDKRARICPPLLAGGATIGQELSGDCQPGQLVHTGPAPTQLPAISGSHCRLPHISTEQYNNTSINKPHPHVEDVLHTVMDDGGGGWAQQGGAGVLVCATVSGYQWRQCLGQFTSNYYSSDL